jgi:hypothetical protein
MTIPKKIVIRVKGNQADEGFKFSTELSVARAALNVFGEP